MKQRIPKNAVDSFETVVDQPLGVVVKRLIDQNGICRDTIGSEYELCFFCDKDGRFYISHKELPYSLSGICRADGANTKIYAYVTFDKGHGISRAISIIICALYLALIGWATAFDSKPILPIVLAVIVSVVIFGVDFVRLKSLKTPSPEQLPNIVFVMKDEVLKRIDAIRRWDE